LYDLNEAYGKKFFARRRSLSWRVPIFIHALTQVYSPRTVIDFGCGDGDLVRGFIGQGINAFGIEGTENCIEYLGVNAASGGLLGSMNRVIIHDLRTPIRKLFSFDDFGMITDVDLVLCLEVAEHLEEEYSDILIKNILVSDKIVFTAAPPGQEGNHHVNLKSREWWIGKFGKYKYVFDYDSISMIKYLLELSGKSQVKGIKAWYQNLMCFKSM